MKNKMSQIFTSFGLLFKDNLTVVLWFKKYFPRSMLYLPQSVSLSRSQKIQNDLRLPWWLSG